MMKEEPSKLEPDSDSQEDTSNDSHVVVIGRFQRSLDAAKTRITGKSSPKIDSLKDDGSKYGSKPSTPRSIGSKSGAGRNPTVTLIGRKLTVVPVLESGSEKWFVCLWSNVKPKQGDSKAHWCIMFPTGLVKDLDSKVKSSPSSSSAKGSGDEKDLIRKSAERIVRNRTGYSVKALSSYSVQCDAHSTDCLCLVKVEAPEPSQVEDCVIRMPCSVFSEELDELLKDQNIAFVNLLRKPVLYYKACS